MKVLSLFDGISCARLALERSGHKVNAYYASEVDKYAIQVAQKNYPDSMLIGDVKGDKTEQRLETSYSEKANTITSAQKDSMVLDIDNKKHIIRKLTPIEAERLQGVPDNYTEGLSNTQRYKCLGNAFNVDVVAHILSII